MNDNKPRGAIPGTGIWRFGSVVLNETLAELQVAGRSLGLDRSSYDVLLALLRHAGEVVTKDELLDAGWPDRVVSENSLAKAISRLRTALEADGQTLKAVHGYGYRLAAPVSFTPALPQRADPAHSEPLREGAALPHRPGWRLVRRLGEGSAGVIWAADSVAGERRAIKFASSESGLHCLKREIGLSRYIQSVRPGLPGVAPVLSSNLSQPPFFLEMPYYPHGNLHDWVAACGGLAALPLHERLALFAALCDAVAELHEIGVIHKDIKPDNLYPQPDPDTGEGNSWRVILSDLGAGEAAPSLQLAQLGLTMSVAIDRASPQAGSLLYLAPEAIAGGMPTQRSDVFSLGVLLYQLVVGDLRRPLAPGWEDDIDDELLREDIALAAAANPERRQTDARGLAERMRTLQARHAARTQEHLHAVAVARQQAQLARLKQRRKWSLAIAGTLALGLLGTAGMYLYAERARRQAEQSAAQRKAVLDFITGDILSQADPYATRGHAGMSVREAVDRAAERVDRDLANEPAAAAAVHATIGGVYFGQDRHVQAIAHYRKARALYRPLGAAQLPELVKTEAALCDVFRIASDYTRAEEACQSALAAARKGGTGEDVALLKLGQLRAERQRCGEATMLLRPLLSSEVIGGDRQAQTELYWTLGLCARGEGHFKEASDYFARMLDLSRQHGENSTWAAWAYNSLASVMVETGDYSGAEPLLVNARRIFLETQGAGVEAQMPNVWRIDARLRQGRWREASELLHSQRQDWNSLLKPEHPLRLKAEANLAWAEAGLGDKASALRRLRNAIDNRAQVFDRPGDLIAGRTLRWARVALMLNSTGDARMLLDLFDRRGKRELADSHPSRAEALCLHAALRAQLGQSQAAREQAGTCRAQLLRALKPGHPLVREADALLASANTGAPSEHGLAR